MRLSRMWLAMLAVIIPLLFVIVTIEMNVSEEPPRSINHSLDSLMQRGADGSWHVDYSSIHPLHQNRVFDELRSELHAKTSQLDDLKKQLAETETQGSAASQSSVEEKAPEKPEKPEKPEMQEKPQEKAIEKDNTSKEDRKEHNAGSSRGRQSSAASRSAQEQKGLSRERDEKAARNKARARKEQERQQKEQRKQKALREQQKQRDIEAKEKAAARQKRRDDAKQARNTPRNDPPAQRGRGSHDVSKVNHAALSATQKRGRKSQHDAGVNNSAYAFARRFPPLERPMEEIEKRTKDGCPQFLISNLSALEGNHMFEEATQVSKVSDLRPLDFKCAMAEPDPEDQPEVHLIVTTQHGKSLMPGRAQEIQLTMAENLRNRHVSMIHMLLTYDLPKEIRLQHLPEECQAEGVVCTMTPAMLNKMQDGLRNASDAWANKHEPNFEEHPEDVKQLLGDLRNHPKLHVVFMEHPGYLTYRDLFIYMKENVPQDGAVAIVHNIDIMWGESLGLHANMPSNELWMLSRHQTVCDNGLTTLFRRKKMGLQCESYFGSHDTFGWKQPLSMSDEQYGAWMDDVDHPPFYWGSENRLIMQTKRLFKKEKLKINLRNPCREVHVMHIHCSARGETSRPRLQGSGTLRPDRGKGWGPGRKKV